MFDRCRIAAHVAASALLAPTLFAQQAPRTWRTETTIGWRTRVEDWNWFDTVADDRYVFAGSLLRAGATARRPGLAMTIEGAAPILLNLPTDAFAPVPRGQLGLGAAYSAANDTSRNVATVFVKQAFVRIGAAPNARGIAMRVGRFEMADGAELLPREPVLATLKRERVSQRLLGAFGWTHVGRSFDGVQGTYVRPGRELTFTAVLPTEGAFRARAWRPLDVGVVYGALTMNGGLVTKPRGAADVRLFALHYADWRPIAPVDNRPATTRLADTRGVRLTTLGGHALWARATPLGAVDALLWGARQAGDWGRLTHAAGAAAIELGVQPKILPAVRPWLRAWWYRGSGDDNANDTRHGTFFEVLPTPRPYARFPFHNLMNVDQQAVSLSLRPSARVTVRSDVQALRLASSSDLWYAGGGAFERASFGYAGRSTSGRGGLATLLDVSADMRLTPRVALNGYAARARSRDGMRAVYPGTTGAWFGYVELDVRR